MDRILVKSATATLILAATTVIASFVTYRQVYSHPKNKPNEDKSLPPKLQKLAEKEPLSSASANDDPSEYESQITDALTPYTIHLLMITSNIVGSKATADKFYQRLFTLDPEIRKLFPSSSSSSISSIQSLKFGQMMKWTTETLQYLLQIRKGVSSASTTNTTTKNSDSNGTSFSNQGSNNKSTNNIAQSMKELGRRHIQYGVLLKHFRPVKYALLDAIKEIDFSSIEVGDLVSFDDGEDQQELWATINDSLSKKSIPVTDIVRAWESLIYAFVGYMGPILLLENPNESLITYTEALENDLAAPAGGTATSLSASQGVALLIMSVRLTKKPRNAARLRQMNAESKLQSTKNALQQLAGHDMASYCQVMVAVRQPLLKDIIAFGGDNSNSNNSHQLQRKQAIDDALEKAANIPLQVVQWSIYALQITIEILPYLAKSGIGDAGAGAYMIIAATKTGLQNIRINTTSSIQEDEDANDELIRNLTMILDWQENQLMKLLP